MIASGVDEKMRLGSALIELVESKHELAAKQAAANEAAEETGVAVTVVNDAIDALAQPPAAVAVAAKVEEPSHVAKSRRR
jgi:hypothetical protein